MFELEATAPKPTRAWTPCPKSVAPKACPTSRAHSSPRSKTSTWKKFPPTCPAARASTPTCGSKKTNLPADALFAHVSRVFKVSRRDIGYAGLKDTRATTLQYLSVPRTAVAKVAEDWAACTSLLETPQVRLVEGNYHQNKLRCGHLRGNRFTVTLRGCGVDDLARAQATAELLKTLGMPNYYGSQRFGRDHSTLHHGMTLLLGDTTRKSGGARQAWLDKLALSAVQSALFNDYLALREQGGHRDAVMDGDILQVCASGGLFLTDDPSVDQARFASGEVVPAGPMFGPSMKAATGAADALEQAVLTAADLTAEAFTRHKRLTQGTRRATLIRLDDMHVEPGEASTLRLRFTLPSGSYATEVVEEFTGAPAARSRVAPVADVAPEDPENTSD